MQHCRCASLHHHQDSGTDVVRNLIIDDYDDEEDHCGDENKEGWSVVLDRAISSNPLALGSQVEEPDA